jgi:hypothetical protein
MLTTGKMGKEGVQGAPEPPHHNLVSPKPQLCRLHGAYADQTSVRIEANRRRSAYEHYLAWE